MASRVSPGFAVVDLISSFYAEKFSDLSHLLHNIIHLSYTDFLTHTTFFVISGHQKDSCCSLVIFREVFFVSEGHRKGQLPFSQGKLIL